MTLPPERREMIPLIIKELERLEPPEQAARDAHGIEGLLWDKSKGKLPRYKNAKTLRKRVKKELEHLDNFAALIAFGERTGPPSADIILLPLPPSYHRV
jgi:hypothetical protein